MKKHYTREALELFRNHQMSVLGRIACSAHLKECEQCAKLFADLLDDDELLRKLRKSVQHYEALRNGNYAAHPSAGKSGSTP